MTESHLTAEKAAGHNWTDAQRSAVIEEVNLILAHPIFKTSNRCVALLRWVVDRALAGKENEIKERTLGVEVFGRSTDYDVSTDPIVRRVANEIRKRLAQYYLEEGAKHRIRIQLVRGSYYPEFEFAPDNLAPERTLSSAPENEPEPSVAQELVVDRPKNGTSPRKARQRGWGVGIAVAVLIAVLAFAAGFLLIGSKTPYSRENRIWKPLLDAGSEIVVCLPDDSLRANNNTAAASQGPSAASNGAAPSTLFRDARVSNNITATLLRFNAKTQIRASSSLKFWDFHQAPVVLIGGLNNPWVPVLLSNLRYTVQSDPSTGDAWVQDARNPSQRKWEIDGKRKPGEPPPVDYAIVTRYFDQQTEQWVLALSGLEEYGTEAAADLVADPDAARLIPSAVRDRGNFQIVLKTSVIGGETGPLQILAVDTW